MTTRMIDEVLTNWTTEAIRAIMLVYVPRRVLSKRQRVILDPPRDLFLEIDEKEHIYFKSFTVFSAHMGNW